MTWAELLRQRLPLAHEHTIEDLMMACPSDYFGKNAPDVMDSSKCVAVIKRGYGQCRQCWNSEVPSEILAAYEDKELARAKERIRLPKLRLKGDCPPDVYEAGGCKTFNANCNCCWAAFEAEFEEKFEKEANRS